MNKQNQNCRQIFYYSPKDAKSKELYDIVKGNNLQQFFRYVSVVDEKMPIYITQVPAIEINPVKQSKQIFVGKAAIEYVALQNRMGANRDPVPHDSYKCVPTVENSNQQRYNNYVR